MPRQLLNRLAVTACGVCACASAASGQATWYVDDDAALAGDGTSWNTAQRYLQDAMAVAERGDEIHVAGGTYKPDKDEAGNVTPGDRAATFELLDGVAIKGGYAGCGALDPNMRDYALYETVLSGDLNNDDDEETIECTSDEQCEAEYGASFCDTYTGRCWVDLRDDNSYHVVTGSGTDLSAVLDGFTIRAGNSRLSSSPHGDGGGLYIVAGSPAVENCTFDENQARNCGAGMFVRDGNPTVTSCTFRNNSTSINGAGMYNAGGNPEVIRCTFMENRAGRGAGMYNAGGAGRIVGCAFIRNFARHRGGGVFNDQADPSFSACTFTENEGSGGGMHNSSASPTLVDCIFTANVADSGGGGMQNKYSSSPTLVNCAFVHNVAHGGGGMHNNGQFGYVSAPTLIDCVFVGNLATRGQTKSQWGGGVANGNEGNATLINCLFTGNKSHRGGAIGNYSSKPLIINCTLSGNVADFGGGLFNTQFSEPQLRNCVVWDNTGTQIYNREDLGANYPQVYYSCVQGGWSGAGGGNIHAAPVFVPGPGGCYYLSQVSAGQAVDSPCLDGGGDTAKYLGFNTVTTRSDEATDTGMVDMGYHYPVTGKPLVMGDFDRNLDVDLADFVGLQNCFTGDSPAGISPCCRVFDFEPDEDVDLTDYGAFEILFNP